MREVLESLEVQAEPSEVCVVDGDGEQVECFSSRTQAETYLAGIQVGPKAESSPSASTSPSASPSSSASPSAGPSPAASAYCLTAPTGDQIGCFKSRAKARGREGRVEDRGDEARVLPGPGRARAVAHPSPSATPAPSASASASASASTSPSASPSPTPATFADLDLSGADPLPCNLGSREAADAALAAIVVVHEEQQFCVVSSAGKQLGCSVTRDKAEDLRRQSGQERLLRVIGETARLEERRVLEVVPVSDPRPITCGTAEERDLPRCSFDALENKEVVYPGPSGNGQVAKFVLGPVVISGEDFNKAGGGVEHRRTARRRPNGRSPSSSTATAPSGSRTRPPKRSGAPPPTDQIAIIVDRVVISSPTVQSAITGGVGEITGRFLGAEAKDLAHPVERRCPARGAHPAVGANGEPDARR